METPLVQYSLSASHLVHLKTLSEVLAGILKEETMAEVNYYDVLGVSKGSTDPEIKKAYRKLAMYVTATWPSRSTSLGGGNPPIACGVVMCFCCISRTPPSCHTEC